MKNVLRLVWFVFTVPALLIAVPLSVIAQILAAVSQGICGLVAVLAEKLR